MATIYCRHIRTTGRRCCSPALRTSAFCYYHGHSIERHRGLYPKRDPTPTIIHPLNTTENSQRDPIIAEHHIGTSGAAFTLDFPALEDRESVQVAISMLLAALGQGRIDGKRAAPMLYGLQVASSNAKSLNVEHGDKVVRTTTTDAAGHELAPDEDPQEITEFNEWLANYEAEEGEDDEDDGLPDAED